jgi:hypothetical protein
MEFSTVIQRHGGVQAMGLYLIQLQKILIILLLEGKTRTMVILFDASEIESPSEETIINY